MVHGDAPCAGSDRCRVSAGRTFGWPYTTAPQSLPAARTNGRVMPVARRVDAALAVVGAGVLAAPAGVQRGRMGGPPEGSGHGGVVDRLAETLEHLGIRQIRQRGTGQPKLRPACAA